jgi:hypothetical protein
VSAPTDRPDDDATTAAGGDPPAWSLPADAGVATGSASGPGAGATGAEPAGAYAAGAAEGNGSGGGSGASDPLSALLEKLPAQQQQLIDDKPEILAGGAFAVGFLFAKILKRIGGG